MKTKIKFLLRIVLFITPILLMIILASVWFVFYGENNLMGVFQISLAWTLGWIFGYYIRAKNKTKTKDSEESQTSKA